jgi:AraC-like DNA-binding protein
MLGTTGGAGLPERGSVLDQAAQRIARPDRQRYARGMSRLLSTTQVDPRDRLSYWIDAVCDTYVQLDCDAPEQGGSIEGEIRLDTLSTLELSCVTASAQHVRRTPAKIADASEDYFLVSIQTVGQGAVVQDGRRALLRPGDFALYDSTRPYELLFEGDFQQYVLMLPGPALRSQLRDTQMLTARPVSGRRGAGHLMIGMIQSLAKDIDTLEPASAAAVAQSVEHILVAGLCSLRDPQLQSVSQLTAFHREQIKAFVRERLRDPQLGVAQIAAHLRLSPSTVHRVFAGEPCSISDWIWAHRLDGVKRDLCDPALASRSVSELAFSWGFNDAAHFSRAFRARFGCTPRDLRAGTARPHHGQLP